MQIVSIGDNLHGMSNPVFWENKKNIISYFPNGDNLHGMSNPVFWENKKNIINLLSVELAQKVLKLNSKKTNKQKRNEHLVWSYEQTELVGK